MKVKIVSVTDLDGNEKDKWIWGAERVMEHVPIINCPLILVDFVLEKTRITSYLRRIEKGLGNQTKYYTVNSIYTLEEVV